MAAACALSPPACPPCLAATDADEVAALIDAAGLTPANRNGAGQIVAAGATDGLAALAANPPPGARVRSLAVAGAFHTHFMGPAEDALRAYAAPLTAADPRLLLLLQHRRHGRGRRGVEILPRLVRQVTRPVRWDLCQQTAPGSRRHARRSNSRRRHARRDGETRAARHRPARPEVAGRPADRARIDQLSSAARPRRAHTRLPGGGDPGEGDLHPSRIARTKAPRSAAERSLGTIAHQPRRAPGRRGERRRAGRMAAAQRRHRRRRAARRPTLRTDPEL